MPSVIDGLLGMKVLESSAVPGDMVILVRNGEMMHRFVWTANALADQEREIEVLRGRLAGCATALRHLASFGQQAPTTPGHDFSPPCWCDADGRAGRHAKECVAALAALHEAEKLT